MLMFDLIHTLLPPHHTTSHILPCYLPSFHPRESLASLMMFDEQRKHLIALLSYLMTRGGQGPGPGAGFEPLNPFALPSSSFDSIEYNSGCINNNNNSGGDNTSGGNNSSQKSPVKVVEGKTARGPGLGLLARVKGESAPTNRPWVY